MLQSYSPLDLDEWHALGQADDMRGPAAEGLPDLGDQRPVNHLERRLCRGERESPLLKRPKGVVVARDRGATGVAARQLGALPAVTAG